MDPGDDDNIEFDFFEDEPPTTEAQPPPSRVRLPRRGGGGKRPSGPSRGFRPILRLLALIAVLVAALVFFGLLIQSCASTSRHDSYSSYMSHVQPIAHGSQEDGAAVATALTTGGSAEEIAKTLDGIAQQERQNVVAASGDLDPPGQLRPANERLVDALQLRAEGVENMADILRSTTKATTTADAALLANQGDRLVASDVVYSDLYKAPATQVMKDEGVSGVTVPDSVFVTSRDLYTERSFQLMLQRLQGASTSGGTVTGLHGTNLIGTKWEPGGHPLSTTTETTVQATTDLGFTTTVKNSGDFQEVGVVVTMTLQRDNGGKALVQTKTIDHINPGEEKSVEFTNLNVTGFFALNSHLRINVKPVKGEVYVSNNKASYPIIFTLPP